MRKTAVFLAIALIVSGCIPGSMVKGGKSEMKLETVKNVDIERYTGRWYEIARFPSTFENGLVGVTAEYSVRKDGKIKVVNSGYKNSLDGEKKSIEGVAWVPKKSEPGKLKVRFFWPFSADYWIIGLDRENYEWALVGNKSRKYLWILSRKPFMKDCLYGEIVELAKEKGFPVEYLETVEQKIPENH